MHNVASNAHKISQEIKGILNFSEKAEKYYNFFRLYGFDGVKYYFYRHWGKYKVPLDPLPEYDVGMPIFVVSYNRLDCLKKLMSFFEKRNLLKNVIIIDNNSTFPPLLDYLRNAPCRVLFLKKNYGHLALWKCHKFDDIILNKPFVLTDCDVVPMDEIPDDFLERMYDCLRRHDNLTKVGLSLTLDDIPDCYDRKQEVLAWEEQFWVNRLEDDSSAFDASIDTTFAVYRPDVPPSVFAWWSSARLDKPYSARHLGWYADSEHPTDEEIWYANTIDDRFTAWFGKDYFKKTKVR